MAKSRIRYISSQEKDYLLPPSAQRRYYNSMIGFFAFYLTAFGIAFAHFVFPQAPFLAPLFHLLVAHDAVSHYGGDYMREWFMAYGLNFALTGPAAWFLMNLSTKPVSRQDYLSGNRLEDGPNVLDLLEHGWNDEERGEIALIRSGEPDYNRDVSGWAKLRQDILLPKSILELSTVVRGEAGSGKSVFLNRIIKEIIKNQHKLILHSIKGDEVEMLDGYTRRIIIAPWMENTFAIDFLSLCISDIEADQNARIRTLVDSFTPKKSGGDPYFVDGAKSIVEALVRCAVIKKKQNSEVGLEEIVETWNRFNAEEDDPSEKSKTLQAIKEFMLIYNPTASKYVDPNSEKASLSVLASCIEVMRKFETLSSFWKNKKIIDIRRWIKEENAARTIILVNSNTHGDVADCYISAFINLTTSILIDPSYVPKGKIYFVLDEYPQLRSIDPDTFLKLPDVGRGKLVRVLIAAQRTSQLAFNGKEGGSFCAAFANKVWGRPSTDDLSIMEEDLGKKSVLEHTVSISFNGGGKTTSRKETEKIVNVANAHDIQNELGPQKVKDRFLGVRMLFKYSNTEIVPIITMPPVSFPPRRKEQKKPKEAISFVPNAGKTSGDGDSTIEEGRAVEVDRASELENDLIFNSQTSMNLDPPTVEHGEEEPMMDAAKEGAVHAFDHTGTAGAISTSLDILDSMTTNGNAHTEEPTPILSESESNQDDPIKMSIARAAMRREAKRKQLER